MNVKRIVEMWSQANPAQQYRWAQQIRFDITLQESDVNDLLALYNTVLDHQGAMQRTMEEALITTLVRLCCPTCIPLFEDILFATPSRGNSPLAEIVTAVGDITTCADAKTGYALLEKCLHHPNVDVRDMATTALVRAYRNNGHQVPPHIIHQLYDLLQGDGARRVRFSAGLALQELGEIDLVDVIFWSEDLAGWEEDERWDIDDRLIEDGFLPPDGQNDPNEAGLFR